MHFSPMRMRTTGIHEFDKAKSLVPKPQTPLYQMSLLQYTFLSHENVYHWRGVHAT